MTGWIVFGAIVLFFVLLFSLKATFVIAYAQEFSVRLNVLILSFGIFPKADKKPRIKDGKSRVFEKNKRKELKKQQKSDAKAQKKRLKKEEKKQAKASGKSNKKSLDEILDLISMASGAVGKLLASFGKHLRVKAMRVHVVVGGDDAAKTAQTYGIICYALSYVIGPLSDLRGFRIHQKNISVQSDFLADASTFDVEIRLSLRLWHLFAMIFAALGSVIRHYIKKFIENKKQSGGKTYERNKVKAGH